MNQLTTNKLSEFSDLVKQGIECWVKAGQLVVEMIEEDNLTVSEIAEKVPGLSDGVISNFERLGRKQLLPALLVDDYPAVTFLQRLPYSEQERLQDQPVDVLIDGGADTLQVQARNLTPLQCRQVFDGSKLRDTGGQKAFIETEKAKSVKQERHDPLPYEVKRGHVEFNRGCKLTAGQMSQIMAQMVRG